MERNDVIRGNNPDGPTINTLSIWSDRQADVCRMKYEDDLNQREIGERLGISQQMVAKILAEALAAIDGAKRQSAEILIDFGTTGGPNHAAGKRR